MPWNYSSTHPELHAFSHCFGEYLTLIHTGVYSPMTNQSTWWLFTVLHSWAVQALLNCIIHRQWHQYHQVLLQTLTMLLKMQYLNIIATKYQNLYFGSSSRCQVASSK